MLGKSEFNRGDSQDFYTLTDDISTTPAIDLQGYAAVQVIFPAAYASTSAGIYVSHREEGDYVRLASADGTNQTITIAASTAVTLSATVFPSWWMKLVTDADDSDKQVILLRKA